MNTYKQVGFWLRLYATVIDIVIAAGIVGFIKPEINKHGLYVQYEMAFIITLWILSSVPTWLYKGSLGKLIMGIHVQTDQSEGISLFKAIVREGPAKWLSGMCLLWGFIRIGTSASKQGYHDQLVKSFVVFTHRRTLLRGGVIGGITLAGFAYIAAGVLSLSALMPYLTKINLRNTVNSAEWQAIKIDSTGPEAVDPREYSRMVCWIETQSVPAEEYIINVAMEHDLTVVGEIHGKKEYLEMLSRILSELYYKAGVRCLALEWCLFDDNDEYNALVTAESFDEQEALRLARKSVWQCWGYKEYWDILRRVWEINRSLSPDDEPLRVAGINFNWDGPSMVAVREGGAMQRMGVIRVMKDIVYSILGDIILARNVQEVIRNTDGKVLVWAGASHAPLNKMEVVIRYNDTQWCIPRMGTILKNKYGNQIGQVLLHGEYMGPNIESLIEQASFDANLSQIGFDIAGSPCGHWFDSTSRFGSPGNISVFEDHASGYIFLVPEERLSNCTWIQGFITKEMYGRNKPFYEILCKSKLTNYEEADVFISHVYGVLGQNE